MSATGATILPCKGRWIAKRDGGVSPFGMVGVIRSHRGHPSTAVSAVPLPLQGRI